MQGATISPFHLRSKAARVASACLAALAVSLCLVPPAAAQDEPEERPSILLIVTDDQRWDTLWAMPEVQRSLVERGVNFEDSFTTSSLCCPSRASILTGEYPHTTEVYRQGGRYGGFRAFDDSTTIATELHDAGYRTGFFGKYLDAYQHGALTGYVPPGWDRWVAFVHSQFFDYGLTVDGTVRRRGFQPDDYSTDVLAAHTEDSSGTPRAPCSPSSLPRRPMRPRPRRRRTSKGSAICPCGGLPRSTSRTALTSRGTSRWCTRSDPSGPKA